jgi:hypothetical protein
MIFWLRPEGSCDDKSFLLNVDRLLDPANQLHIVNVVQPKLDKLRYHEMLFGRVMSLRIYSWLLNIKKFNRLHESYGMSFMLFVSDLGLLQLYY